jgi:hypothetical protein
MEIGWKPCFTRVLAGFSGRFQSLAPSGKTASRRCQSTPETSHSHCAGDRLKNPSPGLGQVKEPLCKRRWASHTPLPSQANTARRDQPRHRSSSATQRGSAEAGSSRQWPEAVRRTKGPAAAGWAGSILTGTNAGAAGGGAEPLCSDNRAEKLDMPSPCRRQ